MHLSTEEDNEDPRINPRAERLGPLAMLKPV